MSKRKDKNPAFSAAKVIPDLCGDPSIEKEIKYGMGKIEVNDNAELRELLSKAIKRLEHVTGVRYAHVPPRCDELRRQDFHWRVPPQENLRIDI